VFSVLLTAAFEIRDKNVLYISLQSSQQSKG
jgi:hypothetical protein